MMTDFLILRLQGPMQAWGKHTFEDYRPIERFPTRSGLVGLLGACLGIERQDIRSRESLSASFKMAVRSDFREETEPCMLTDYHTILAARKAVGKRNKIAVQSYREYMCDTHFTVALSEKQSAEYSLKQLENAVKSPCYTPSLGRRSCPLSRPLFETCVQANDLVSALQLISPRQGTIYSEEGKNSLPRMQVRDVPMSTKQRQFATREIFVIQQENAHVSESV